MTVQSLVRIHYYVQRSKLRTRVSLALLDIAPIPLTNARTASVSEHETADFLKSSHLTVTSDSSTNLFGTGSDSELALGVQTVFSGLTSDGSSAGHILVRRVGARTDQSNLELNGPVVLLDSLGKLGDRGSQIRSERTVDMGLELGQVLQELSITSIN